MRYFAYMKIIDGKFYFSIKVVLIVVALHVETSLTYILQLAIHLGPKL